METDSSYVEDSSIGGPGWSPDYDYVSHPEPSSLLVEAARIGDIEGLKSKLLDPSGEVNAQELNYGLLKAAGNGHSECVKILIDANADLNAEYRNKSNNTPLVEAAEKNHAGVAKQLIEAGASVNKTTLCGETSLYYAISHENFDFVELLLDAGIETDLIPPDGFLPLYESVSHNNYAITELLLQRGAHNNPQVNHNIQGALHEACNKGNIEIVHLLLNYGAQIDGTSLAAAFSKNHTHLARFLVERCVDSDIVRPSMGKALCDATGMENTSALISLLNAGISPNFVDEDRLPPVLDATIYCYVETVKLLIQYGCNVDVESETYLYFGDAHLMDDVMTDLITVSPIYAAVWNKHVELSSMIYMASLKTQKQIESILSCNDLKKEIKDHQGINTWLEDTFSNPPSLSHLCRKNIRAIILPQQVWHVSSLSQTVSKLAIPQLLKEYLLMQM